VKKLKPCPFCGNTPSTFDTNQGTKWGFVVCCIQGPEVRTSYKPEEHWREDAIRSWNDRCDSHSSLRYYQSRDELQFFQLKVREAYEAWAGSELPQNPSAETAPEAYAYKVIGDILEPIMDAIKELDV